MLVIIFEQEFKELGIPIDVLKKRPTKDVILLLPMTSTLALIVLEA
jgi:hypothetical protein